LDAIAPETLATNEQADSLDRRLYRFACKRLDEPMREYRVPDSGVIALRRASNVYSTAHRVLGLLRELWHEAQRAMARRRFALNG